MQAHAYGTRVRPAGTGSRRTHFALTPADAVKLAAVKESAGLETLAEAVRHCLRVAAARPGGESPWCPDRSPRVTWSQWVRPEDLGAIRALRERFNLGSDAAAIRHAVRVTALTLGSVP